MFGIGKTKWHWAEPPAPPKPVSNLQLGWGRRFRLPIDISTSLLTNLPREAGNNALLRQLYLSGAHGIADPSPKPARTRLAEFFPRRRPNRRRSIPCRLPRGESLERAAGRHGPYMRGTLGRSRANARGRPGR